MALWKKRQPRRYLEFLILNWEEANERDPMAVPDLDEALAGAGAIPVGGSDTPRGAIYRVEVTRPDLDPQELLAVFARLGFRVEVVGDEG